MATFFLRVSKVSRGKGARVTRAAAYRAGERIHDERSSDVYNFSSRQDIAFKEVVLPADLAENPEMAWAHNRSTLWNAVEHAGYSRNALLAREYLVLLPPELTPSQRGALARGFAQELADRYRNAVDCVVHYPRPGSDSRHHHAHLLMTTREVGPGGIGARTVLELSGTERHARGLGPSKEDYLQTRERWAELTNDALAKAGMSAHVDHRSLRQQGVEREPAAVIPQKVYYAERKSGLTTDVGDEIRAKHRERVEALKAGRGEREEVVKRQRAESSDRFSENASAREGSPKRVPRSALTRAELNERRRTRYHANAEQLKDKRREKYRQNAETERRKYRDWRRANAPEVNERRRQWRAENTERANHRAREYRQRRSEHESARRWLRARGGEKESQSAMKEAALDERALSEVTSARPDDALEAARKWLELREQDPHGERSTSDAGSESVGPLLEPDDDDDDSERTRGKDLDVDVDL